jgi:hypothetical protein
MCTVSVNVASAPDASVGFVHVTDPVAPTAGVEHDHPNAELSETNVVPVGTASSSWTLSAASGPKFATVTW